MTTATAPAVEKRKKPWTKARVIDLIIDIFCFVIVGAASLTCILPFIHILAKSLSDNAYVVANRVILLPMSDAGINLDAYNKVFHDPTIMQSLWVTALVTVVFTAIGMFLTVCASYALTRPEFHGRKVFTFMIMFTMYFTAGTIPDYLLMNQLHMLDNVVDGINVYNTDYTGDDKLSNNNNKDYWCLVQEVQHYGDEAADLQANKTTLAPAGYDWVVQDAYDLQKKGESGGIITPIFSKAVQATTEYSADLNSLWQEAYVDCVTCSPDEFESKYEEYCQEYLDAGYQEILDEKASLIADGNVLVVK